MTLRAVIFGFLGSMFIAGFGYVNDRVLELESFNNGHQLPIVVMGVMFFLVLILNPLVLKACRKRAFKPAEIGFIVVLMMAACSIPGRGLMEQFLQVLVMPHHWNRVYPEWQGQKLLDYAPEQALVNTEPNEDVVSRFMFGSDSRGEKGESWIGYGRRVSSLVPWSQWRTPLRTWLPMIFLTAVCSISMALIVHKQWSDHELLRYPIAEFTSEIIDRDSEHPFGKILRSRGFWLAFAIFFSIRLNNGLQCWFPETLVPVKLRWDFWPLRDLFPSVRHTSWNWGIFGVNVFPLVIAFSFFLSSEIALTLGISQYLWMFFATPIVTMGISLTTDYDIGGWEGWHRAGSYTALTLMLIYGGRRYYRDLLIKAFVFWKHKADGDPAVWAARFFAASTIGLVILVTRLGLDWTLSIATVALMLMTFLIVSRISAETGLFFIQPGWQPFGALIPLFGGFAMGPTAIVISGLVCAVLCIDQSQALMPYVINGLKIGERLKLKPGALAGSTLVMYVLGVLLAVCVVLCVTYDEGTAQYGWSHQRIPTMAFRAAEPEALKLKATNKLEESQQLTPIQRVTHMRPRGKFLWAAVSGFVMVIVFSVLRLRCSWWPLHPMLFLIWATYPLAVMAPSFLMGWAIKKFVLRYGGHRMAQSLRPFVFGVISAEILGAVLFMIVGAIYYAVTGEKPVSYRYFPR